MHAFQPSGFPVNCPTATVCRPIDDVHAYRLIAQSAPNRRVLIGLSCITAFLALVKLDQHLGSMLDLLLSPSSDMHEFVLAVIAIELLAASVWMLGDLLLPRCCHVIRVSVSAVAALAFVLLYDDPALPDLRSLAITLGCRVLFPPANLLPRIFSFAYPDHATTLIGATKLLPHLLVHLMYVELPVDYPFQHARLLFLLALTPVTLTLLWPSRMLVERPIVETGLASLDPRSRRTLHAESVFELQERSWSRPRNVYRFAVKLLDTAVLFDRAIMMTYAATVYPDTFDFRRDLVGLYLSSHVLAFMVCATYEFIRRRVDLMQQSSRFAERLRVCGSLVGLCGLGCAKLLQVWLLFSLSQPPPPPPFYVFWIAVTLTGFAELARMSLTESSHVQHWTGIARAIDSSSPPAERPLWWCWSNTCRSVFCFTIHRYHPIVSGMLVFMVWLVLVSLYGRDGVAFLSASTLIPLLVASMIPLCRGAN